MAREGLPTDQPLNIFVGVGGRKVEANYIIAKSETVTCGCVWCDVCELKRLYMLLSLLVLVL